MMVMVKMVIKWMMIKMGIVSKMMNKMTTIKMMTIKMMRTRIWMEVTEKAQVQVLVMMRKSKMMLVRWLMMLR